MENGVGGLDLIKVTTETIFTKNTQIELFCSVYKSDPPAYTRDIFSKNSILKYWFLNV